MDGFESLFRVLFGFHDIDIKFALNIIVEWMRKSVAADARLDCIFVLDTGTNLSGTDLH